MDRFNAEIHRRGFWRGFGHCCGGSTDLQLDQNRPRHPKIISTNADWRPPPKTKPSHSNDGNKYRRTDQPLAAGKICWHVDPAARTAFQALFKPKSKAVLYGASPAKSPQPSDADRYERDQCCAGLWLCLTLSLFKMLPSALSNHTLPRAGQPASNLELI